MEENELIISEEGFKCVCVCVAQAKDTWLIKIRENQKLQIVLWDQGRVVG